MKEFTIWFEQVNQQMIRVEARTIESAKIKAQREWHEDNCVPLISDIEEAK